MNILFYIIYAFCGYILTDIQDCQTSNVPKLSTGRYNQGATVIGEHNGKSYSIHHICTLKTHTLILMRLVGYDSVGQAIWEKRAELAIPIGNKKYRIAYGADRCRQDGRFNSKIIGLINIEDGKRFLPATKVWIIDIEQEKIKEVSLAIVECENFSFGI
jgi:hypothetical protein